MSLRRRSCNACFRSRRKCDLGYPVCGYCGKTSKPCEYAYPPTADATEENVEDPLQAAASPRRTGFGTGWLVRREQLEARLGPAWSPGSLGDVHPVEGIGRWKFVHEQMRDYPLQFATQAETMFIHRSLLEEHDFPKALRAAFGICAASLSLTERSKPVMFKAIDAEVRDLLAPPQHTKRTLLDDLVTLQAAVLYQTIRLYHGALEQRVIAEQQEFMLRSYALGVLRRADAELQAASQTWEMWILAESIRRTVVVVFKLYTMYWAFRKGVCFEIEGLNVLPVSMSPELWRTEARGAFKNHPRPDEVLTHDDFTKIWAGRGGLGVDPFQDMLLLGCRRRPGETVEGWREGEELLV